VQVARGEVLAVMGPSGSGKSTLLHCLAGILVPHAGEVHFDGRRIDDQPESQRSALRRDRFGFVFQFGQLVPELSAEENVALPLLLTGMRRRDALARARTWFPRLELDGLERRRSGELSGGQAQRVALARALAVDPNLLLLDEPLAALDARTRLDVRAQLRRHLAEFEAVAVLVTHDPLDAMVLADRLVVIEHGRVVQEGTPADIARHPRTDYIAQLVGLNLYRGQAAGHTVRLDAGPEITTTEDLSGPVFVAFPPSAVTLFRDRPTGASARNLWRCEVAGLETHGDQIRADLTGELPLAADLTTVAAAELGLHPGAAVWATVKATQTHAYPA
jgi:molybdate transport system ATP-binding protein